MQIFHNKGFYIGRSNMFILVVKLDSIEYQARILVLKDSNTSEDINLFLLMIYLYSKVFFVFDINMKSLIYE